MGQRMLQALLLGGALCLMGSGLLSAEESKAATKTASITYSVTGMTCGNCSKAVTTKYKKVDGVQDAAVDLKAGTATITYDPAKVTEEQLAKALEGTKFVAAKK